MPDTRMRILSSLPVRHQGSLPQDDDAKKPTNRLCSTSARSPRHKLPQPNDSPMQAIGADSFAYIYHLPHSPPALVTRIFRTQYTGDLQSRKERARDYEVHRQNATTTWQKLTRGNSSTCRSRSNM